MRLFESIKQVLMDFFTAYSSHDKILTSLTVYTHQVCYNSKDAKDEPKHIVIALLKDPRLIDKYGERVQLVSKNLYFKVKTGDKLTVWLEENPDYDRKHPETRLRLADQPQ